MVEVDPLDVLRTRTSYKWSQYAPDVLPLFVAEMDFPLAEPVAEALTAAVRRSDTGYAPTSSAVPAAFAGFAQRRWGWMVDPDQVFTTTDVSVAIVETLRVVIEPGAPVVITPPVYPPFWAMVTEAGGVPLEVPMTTDAAGYSLDLGALEAAFAGGAKTFLLCNPHNPLGHPHPRDTLRALASLAERYGVTVVSDEIHGPLVLPGATFVPYLSVSEEARRTGVCVTSASKTWNIAGLKCAIFVTADERLRTLIAGLPEEVTFRTGQFGVLGTVAALTDGEPWLDAVLATLDSRRRLVGDLFAEHLPSVGYRPPAASFLAWLDFSSLDWGEDPAVVALERARVALSSGPQFGRQGAGFVRLNFATSEAIISEAVERIAAASLASS